MLFAQAGVRVLAVDFDGGAGERMPPSRMAAKLEP
jgi:hypothetical protein